MCDVMEYTHKQLNIVDSKVSTLRNVSQNNQALFHPLSATMLLMKRTKKR